VAGKKGKAASLSGDAHLVFEAGKNLDLAEGTIALAQRCELAFSAVTTLRRTRLGIDDESWEKLSAEDKSAEIAARLDEKPEVVVIANFDYSQLPGDLRQRILSLVHEGAGLVFVSPSNPPSEIVEPSEEGRRTILTGVPLAAMSDCYPSANLALEDLKAKVAQAYTHGKGRVAMIRWRDDQKPNETGIGPQAAAGIVDRPYEHRYNCYLSLVGKAVEWAAGRAPRAEWAGLPEEGRVCRAGSRRARRRRGL